MKTIDRVMHFLNTDPRTRDNDELLTALIWHRETTTTSTLQFLTEYSERKYTSAESIRRCRQKLQEEFPGLRGKSYSQRHKVNFKQIFE
jgi:hypothetical protein